jgi:hypothetical protein
VFFFCSQMFSSLYNAQSPNQHWSEPPPVGHLHFK